MEGVNANREIPVSFTQLINADRQINIDNFRAIFVVSAHEMPIDWKGTLDINRNLIFDYDGFTVVIPTEVKDTFDLTRRDKNWEVEEKETEWNSKSRDHIWIIKK